MYLTGSQPGSTNFGAFCPEITTAPLLDYYQIEKKPIMAGFEEYW